MIGELSVVNSEECGRKREKERSIDIEEEERKKEKPDVMIEGGA
jgi:hypothetical protein